MAKPENAMVTAVTRAADVLLAHPDFFEILVRQRDVPATEEEVARAEETLGYRLPEVVRSFYLGFGRQLELEWTLRPGVFRKLGYMVGPGADGEDEESDDPDAYGNAPRGILRIAPPDRLDRRKIAGLAQLTVSDGAGNGFGVEKDAATGNPVVVWIDHERLDARRRRYDSVEACFDAQAATLFAGDGDTEGIEAFVQKAAAKKKAKKKASSPAKKAKKKPQVKAKIAVAKKAKKSAKKPAPKKKRKPKGR